MANDITAFPIAAKFASEVGTVATIRPLDRFFMSQESGGGFTTVSVNGETIKFTSNIATNVANTKLPTTYIEAQAINVVSGAGRAGWFFFDAAGVIPVADILNCVFEITAGGVVTNSELKPINITSSVETQLEAYDSPDLNTNILYNTSLARHRVLWRNVSRSLSFSGVATVEIYALGDMPAEVANFINLSADNTNYVLMDNIVLPPTATLQLTGNNSSLSGRNGGLNIELTGGNNNLTFRLNPTTSTASQFLSNLNIGDGALLNAMETQAADMAAILHNVNLNGSLNSLVIGCKNFTMLGGKAIGKFELSNSLTLESWRLESVKFIKNAGGFEYVNLEGNTLNKVHFIDCEYDHNGSNNVFMSGELSTTFNDLRFTNFDFNVAGNAIGGFTKKTPGVWFEGNRGAPDVIDSKVTGSMIIGGNNTSTPTLINTPTKILYDLTKVTAGSNSERFTLGSPAANRSALTCNDDSRPEALIEVSLSIFNDGITDMTPLKIAVFKDGVEMTEASGFVDVLLGGNIVNMSFTVPDSTRISTKEYELYATTPNSASSLVVSNGQFMILES